MKGLVFAWSVLLLTLLVLVGCNSVGAVVTTAPTAVVPLTVEVDITLTPTPRPTFTAVVVREEVVLTPTRTPTAPPAPPTATAVPDFYYVARGDTLLGIAARFGCDPEDLFSLNPGMNENLKEGDFLYVPSSITVNLPAAYFAHDSEVVYSPSYLNWNTAAYIAQQGGYLAQYKEADTTAAEIIDSAAARYRIGPRVLLAALEMTSGWVTNPAPANTVYPFGLEDPNRTKLSVQARWAAQMMMGAYYGQLEGRQDWVLLENRVRARLAPNTNPGSAAVIRFLAMVVKPADNFPTYLQSHQWQDTYKRLFGDVNGGSILPPNGEQPYLALPWGNEEPWYLTGGPHGGWGDEVSGWAALDFAAPIPRGCYPSEYPVTAVSDGVVMMSDQGEVWVDMDGDGDMRTGWVIFYAHQTNRIPAGTYIKTGDIIGYPSCEGGISSGSHLHIARLYNGQWMPASGPVKFQLGEWLAAAVVGDAYDGTLTNQVSGQIISACDCRSDKFNKFPFAETDIMEHTMGH